MHAGVFSPPRPFPFPAAKYLPPCGHKKGALDNNNVLPSSLSPFLFASYPPFFPPIPTSFLPSTSFLPAATQLYGILHAGFTCKGETAADTRAGAGESVGHWRIKKGERREEKTMRRKVSQARGSGDEGVGRRRGGGGKKKRSGNTLL